MKKLFFVWMCLLLVPMMFRAAYGAEAAAHVELSPADIGEKQIAYTPLSENAVPYSDVDNITFRYFYCGFTPVNYGENREAFEAFSSFGTGIISSQEERDDFISTFCPGIPYYEDVDFSKECIVASVMGFARPMYTSADKLISVAVKAGNFEFEYSNNPANFIYALNTESVCHFYIQMLIISTESWR